MPTEDEDPFGGYAPEEPTSGVSKPVEADEPDKIESEKYGLGKPTRFLVRGYLAADKSPQGKGE